MKKFFPLAFLLLSGGCLATQQDMIDLSEQSDSMVHKINQLNKIVRSLQANQADLNEKLDLMHGDVTALNENLDENRKVMGKLSTKLDDVQATIISKVAGVDRQVTANAEQMKAAEKRRRREAAEERRRAEERRELAAEAKKAAAAARKKREAKEAKIAAAEAKKEKAAAKKRKKARAAADGVKPSELYHSARIQLSKKQYDGAADGFALYVEKYPKGETADLALYYHGQARFSQKKWKKAARQYARVLDRFPDSEITAAARLRYAICLVKLNKHLAEAKKYLESIPADFPRSSSAKEAKKLLKGWGKKKK